ncbi:hypothetical protein RDMS_11270 [Deinococcus sp. RL]|uniref:YbaY family lipoprotein n=1 Tax=Deinococcus sp. RL TaxID=1489678 RepID=UPI0004D746D9|nr:YbaY family lipoprotein [Deinococcus sp. RL]KEF33652.1 hypothetical protein RDMS_11270 [Deinococcus sp. RL]
MKRAFSLLLATLVFSVASAQGIRIVRPGTPPSAPAAAPASTSPVPSLADVPAGWRVLGGRIYAPSAVRLPAGSIVTVTLGDTAGATLLEVSFPATRLSAPYQLQYNPVRLNPRREYVVTARVSDARGRLLYRSASAQALPGDRAAALDLRVVPR